MDINIVEGLLAVFKADVIVNSTNPALMLDLGGLSSSIAKVAGPGLQAECSKSYPNGITFGELASTSGYRLACQKVYHVSISSWDSDVVDAKTILQQVIYNCVKQAHDDKMASIAFPTIGCGFLAHPPDVVAYTMKQCIDTFQDAFKETTLKQLNILVLTEAKDYKHILQAFRHEFPDKLAQSEPVSKLLLQDFSKTCIRESARNSCKTVLECGHVCGGFRNEETCPPCLQPECCSMGKRWWTRDDNCIICYTDPLSAAPVIALKCGHVYHLHCTKRILENRWVGPRITFNFTLCPMCKEPMDHTELKQLLEPISALYDDVTRKAMMRLQYEGLENSEQMSNQTSPYYNNPRQFAIDRYCYYPCYKCKKAYFGGTAHCEDGGGDREFKVEEMVCPACSGSQVGQVCKTHGTDFIEYKCRYCCNIAVFYCFGTTHFCNSCHDDNLVMTNMGAKLPQCPAGSSGKQLSGACPLGIEHPPNGTEFCIGCGLCSNLQTF